MRPNDCCSVSVRGIKVVNVHLSNNKEKFKKQSQWIEDALNEGDEPRVVIGDFNALFRPDSGRLSMFDKSSTCYEAYDLLHVFQFRDKVSASDTRGIPTTYKCRIISTQMNKIFQMKCGTIDGILVVDNNSSIVETAVHGVNGPVLQPELMQYAWPSDHYLLLSKVNIHGAELNIASWNVLGESVTATESFNIFEFLPLDIYNQYSDKLSALKHEIDTIVTHYSQLHAPNSDFNINRVSEVLRNTVDKSYLNLFNTHFILPHYTDDVVPLDSPFNSVLYRRLRDVYLERLQLFNEQATDAEKLYGNVILSIWKDMASNHLLAEFFSTWFAYIISQNKLAFGDVLFKYLESKIVDIIGLQEVNVSMVEYLQNNQQAILESGYKIFFGEYAGNTCGVVISRTE